MPRDPETARRNGGDGTWLREVVIDGEAVDVRISDGRFAEITAVGAAPKEAPSGGLLTPHLAEPHVHLDATLLGTRAPNRSGTLREGIANWAALRETITREDTIARATEVVGWYGSWGCTRIRTHVDTACPAAVEGLLELRETLRGSVDLQIVAFPQEGILRARGLRERWEAAVADGCDAVGAIPHFERTADEGWRSVRMAFDLAEKHGIALDFHCDETDDPNSRNLEVVCAEAIDRGYGGRVVAGHCTAMHSYPNPHAAKVIELVVISGVQVVANPLDNVVLQGRYDHYPRRRGLTRVDQLWDAGANVGIGHDSVVDPWYRLGTANLVDAAYMLVHLGHLTSEAQMRKAFGTLHGANHGPWGGPPKIAVGQPADFLLWPEADPIEILRTRPRPRVYRAGILDA